MARMDSMAVNKAVGAVLLAGIFYMGSTIIADTLVHPKRLEQSALKIDVPAAGEAAGGGGAPAPEQPMAVMMASADPAAGQADTKKLCVSCHSFNDGGKAIVGPNLYGVVGGPHAHMAGYDYSAALKAKDGPWTFDELNAWLRKPAAYAPGTKMGFAGIADPKERADVIDYLRMNAKDPMPLPAAASATAAPAAGATPAAPQGQGTPTLNAAGATQAAPAQGGPAPASPAPAAATP